MTATTTARKSPTRPANVPITVVSDPHAKRVMMNASLEWIAADAFTVDASYDRPISEPRVNNMAENWKDEALGVVFASRREDSELLYLLDGQHRVGALKKQNRRTELVPTLVFEGLSVAEEAELFVMMNKNRRALTPSELFKASLVEGDKGAIAIQQVMEGLDLKLESFATAPMTVKCVATVWRLYNAMGAPGVDATLSLILVAWGSPPPARAFNQQLVLILGRILFYGEGRIDLDRLTKVLAQETPETLLARASGIRALQGGQLERILGEVILSSYNKGLPVAKQINPEALRQRSDPFRSATHFRRGESDGE